MRYVAIILLFAPPLLAQGPGTPDQILRSWEDAMGNAQTFLAKVQRSSTSVLENRPEEFRGFIALMKPEKKDAAPKACLNLIKTTNQNILERFICTGSETYEFVPATQTVRVHAMVNNGKQPQQSLLTFVLGMSADKAKDQYVIKTSSRAPDGFHYLHFYPKREQDKANFTVAELAFHRNSFLLARLAYRQPNDSVVTWDFTDIQVNAKNFDRQIFVPKIDKGWRIEREAAVPGRLDKK